MIITSKFFLTIITLCLLSCKTTDRLPNSASVTKSIDDDSFKWTDLNEDEIVWKEIKPIEWKDLAEDESEIVWNDIPDWYRQSDGHSCGYCMLLNAKNYLIGVNKNHNSKKQIVDYLNEDFFFRKTNRLSGNEKLTNSDIDFYLRKHFKLNYGATFQSLASLAEMKKYLVKSDWDFIYVTSNVHFRGITKSSVSGKYIVLDSLQGGPIEVYGMELISLLANSLTQRSLGVYDVISFWSK